MPRWWKIGFVSVLLITTGALSAHVALQEPKIDLPVPSEVAEYADSDYLYWDWAEETDCEIYERCQFIKIYDTKRCPQQILVPMRLEDANDDWVAAESRVIRSPMQDDAVTVELGVDRTDFEYFVVGAIRCTTAIPTVEATL